MNISHQELMKIANEFLQENYNMKMEIPLKFNTRLKSTLGRFMYTKHGHKIVPISIELSVEALTVRPKEQIIDIFKHELVHYACCFTEKPFGDGQSYFENELKRLGISRTNTFKPMGKIHKYTCKNCGSEFLRKKKIPRGGRCTCTPHEENLIYNGYFNKKVENGEEVFEKLKI